MCKELKIKNLVPNSGGYFHDSSLLVGYFYDNSSLAGLCCFNDSSLLAGYFYVNSPLTGCFHDTSLLAGCFYDSSLTSLLAVCFHRRARRKIPRWLQFRKNVQYITVISSLIYVLIVDCLDETRLFPGHSD